MTSEPEGWILGSDWGLRAFATNWINGLKMIMTRDANKITRLKINHNASKQEFQEQKGSWGFSEVRMVFWTLLWNTWISWGWANIRWVLEIILNGIHVAKNNKAVSSKDSRSSKENFGVSCNNKINGETLYEWRVYVVIHRSLSMKGNCKSDEHKFSGYQRRVSSGSSRAADDHQ